MNMSSKKKSWFAINMGWLLQLVASTSWVVSVFIYGLYGLGDYLQLIASTAWTISNLISFPNNLD